MEALHGRLFREFPGAGNRVTIEDFDKLLKNITCDPWRQGNAIPATFKCLYVNRFAVLKYGNRGMADPGAGAEIDMACPGDSPSPIPRRILFFTGEWGHEKKKCNCENAKSRVYMGCSHFRASIGFWKRSRLLLVNLWVHPALGT